MALTLLSERRAYVKCERCAVGHGRGGIRVVANLLYVWRAMRMSAIDADRPDPMRAYRGQAAGEAIKFAATLGVLPWSFAYKSVSPLPLFAGYASTFVIFWLALIRRR